MRPGARQGFRAARGAPEDAVVVMTMGRLSVVEKANPVPLMLALEEVARDLGRPLLLWFTGWASRPEEAELHREAAQLAPFVYGVVLIVVMIFVPAGFVGTIRLRWMTRKAKRAMAQAGADGASSRG